MEEGPGARQPSERIALLDALRGFALLGIFLANILLFSGWGLVDFDRQAALAGDTATHLQHSFHRFFIDGKFYTIFSLLFGAGFALQIDRLTRRGADGLAIYRRRVLILLGFGAVHQWLIWDGDILFLYALLGLILPLFFRLSDRALLGIGALLIFAVPIAGVAVVQAMDWPTDGGLRALSDQVAVALGAVDTADGITWVRRGDFDGWLSWVMSGPFYSWGVRLESWRIPKVLGIMLVGLWLGRRLARGEAIDDRRFLWRVFAIGTAIGVPANLVYAFTGGGQHSLASIIGTVPLALAYVSLFALIWPSAKRVLGIFVAPGQMALTNYLAQSLIGIVTFYGLFFSRIGHWGPGIFYPFAITVFALQVAASRWWLSSHRQGPMEALWRRWTYAGTRPVVPTGSPR